MTTATDAMSRDDYRQRRAALGWSVEAFAMKAGVSVATVRNFEDGLTAPRFVTLIALRKALRLGEAQLGPA